MNKPRAYQVGMVFLACVLIGLSFMPAGRATLVFIVAALAGVGVSDARSHWRFCRTRSSGMKRNSSNRQEAAYYSVITLIQKMVSAGTIAVTGSLLAATGYIERSATQPASALNAIQFLSGPLPAIFFVAGIVLCAFYPISRESMPAFCARWKKKRRCVNALLRAIKHLSANRSAARSRRDRQS
ncbi:MAG: MFS transporter [Anaerolineae bacterium]